MATLRDIAWLRLAAQRIIGPGFETATEVVTWLTAMQAQDLPSAIQAVALRTGSRRRSLVTAALDAGEVVRSWPMRGTLHLVPAQDLSWMLGLTAERLLRGLQTRHAQLGVDQALVGRARDVAIEHLQGGRTLSRAELLGVWHTAGLLEDVPQRGAHLLGALSQTGTLVLGPCDGDSQQRIALLAEWVPHPRRLEPEEALGEWALRYFRGHGPATLKDFAWWTKLLTADIKAAMSSARPRLESVTAEGVEYFMDPATPALLDEHRAGAATVVLLPRFDEHLLGYQDRGATLRKEDAGRVVPGGNGMFLATVVSDGQVVGTWRRGTGKRRSEIDVTAFRPLSSRVQREAAKAGAALPS